jgi:hypothetical protein
MLSERAEDPGKSAYNVRNKLLRKPGCSNTYRKGEKKKKKEDVVSGIWMRKERESESDQNRDSF